MMKPYLNFQGANKIPLEYIIIVGYDHPHTQALTVFGVYFIFIYVQS